MLKKLRGSGGFTLAEMLVVLLVLSLFGSAVLVGLNLAARFPKLLMTRSRALTVSDTINETLRDVLRNSRYRYTEDDAVFLICEIYSGWRISLEAADGCVVAVVYDEEATESPPRREKLLPEASYAEFKVEDFKLVYNDGTYSAEYKLTSEDSDYSEAFGLTVAEGYG